ncbi:MAG: hypothetical protein E7Z67_01830 [Thermoplasmata archaeon]|nr:hypothetical protein [Thermoplasmata archaeon]
MNTKIITILLSLVLVGSATGTYFVLTIDDGDGDETFNYVALGASNTNGYGLRGYISDEEISMVLNDPNTKKDINTYGYQRVPDAGYPALIRNHLSNIHGADNVTLDQLAISSMRVEELRVLLDDTYNGDEYTSWRFIGDDKWFSSAEKGRLDALRSAYMDKVTDADLITVDIGWNNFGTYVLNQLITYLTEDQYFWSIDIATIFDTEAEGAAALNAKEKIGEYIEDNLGDAPMTDVLTDIFAYSLIGYMHNFDRSMERIYELNPDVDVVVIGIQNLLHGVTLESNGQPSPLGDIFEDFIDMANYYTSTCSPYHDKYLYVKVGTDGHMTTFLDYIKEYDGNVENLDQNVKDGFDYYDENILLQPMLDEHAASILFEEYGFFFPAMDCETGEDAVRKGKAGELPEYLFGYNAQEVFDSLYWPALNAAYDTMATMCKMMANMSTLDVTDLLNGTLDMDAAENALLGAVEAEIVDNAMGAAEGKDYDIDLNVLTSNEDVTLVAALNVRFYLGNSFFAHPNDTGHMEVKNTVVQVLDDPEGEMQQELEDDLIDNVIEIQQLLCEAIGHDFHDGVCSSCGKASA